MIKRLFLIAFFCQCIHLGSAQNLPKMNSWQDSLVILSQHMFGAVSEAERLENNFKFVKALVSSLKETNAYFFKYEKLKSISILNAPDNSFRIFSWNIPLEDGSYLYYGSIQHKGPSIKLTPLLDKTFEIIDANIEVLKPNTWFGAQYYDMIQLNPKQFVLLGWKGHHTEYSMKVIDILTINPNSEITFGAKVFSDQIDNTRKIFSYTRQASMYLKYNSSNKQIEFDHIAPADPSLVGNYKYYGPDLSYDAYHIQGNKLKLIEDIVLQNDTRSDDDNYINPLKPKKNKKSGLK